MLDPLLLDYLILSGSAFLSATILPFYSEVVVAAMIVATPDQWLEILCVGALSNTLGSCVNWWLGTRLLEFRDKRWFPVNKAQLDRAQRWFQRYGVWSLLFAWAPVFGDALTVIAGIMRVRVPVFFGLTLVGKTVRYAAVIWLAGTFSA